MRIAIVAALAALLACHATGSESVGSVSVPIAWTLHEDGTIDCPGATVQTTVNSASALRYLCTWSCVSTGIGSMPQARAALDVWYYRDAQDWQTLGVVLDGRSVSCP